MAERLEFDSIDEAQFVDRLCDQFEEAWRSEKPITIEECIHPYQSSIRSELICTLIKELILLEWDLRRKSGEQPELADYAQRFSQVTGFSLSGFQPNASRIYSDSEPTLSAANLRADSNPNAIPPGTNLRYIGDYEILSVVARGGMGIVYKARQLSLGRIVALKMILGGHLADSQDVNRFRAEATAAATLDHPNIVPIYEVGEYEGQCYYSMGFVEGGTLADRLRDGPLPIDSAVKLMIKVTDAVSFAHEHGVIHRDLKPANVLIDEKGDPRVADFGLAKNVFDESELTRTGQVIGTPSYMPPEQAAAQANFIGPTSDVYALGAVLYTLLTGRPPFQAASALETLLQVQHQNPVSPRQLNPSIPIDLETIVLKCLDKSAPRRYSSARDLADELQRVIDGVPILARPVSRIEHAWRWCKRNPAVATLWASVFLLLLTGFIGSYLAYRRESGFRQSLDVAFKTQKTLTQQESEARQRETQSKLEAEQAAKDAESARQKEAEQTRVAEQERDKAKISQAFTRRNLYIADMIRAQECIEDRNLRRAYTLLARHIPQNTDEEDYRSFDWAHLWQQVSNKQSSFQYGAPLEAFCLSPNGSQVVLGFTGGHVVVVDAPSGKPTGQRFQLTDPHWARLAYIDKSRLLGVGINGGFAIWDLERSLNLCEKPAGNDMLRKQGMVVEDRLPATVTRDGKYFVAADPFEALAEWDSSSIRPHPLPRLNEGNHFKRINGTIMNAWFITGEMQFDNLPSAIDQNWVADNGFKSFDDQTLSAYGRQALNGYVVPGKRTMLPLATNVGQEFVGHPLTCLEYSQSGEFLYAASADGRAFRWSMDELRDPNKWSALSVQSTRMDSSLSRMAVAPNDQLVVVAGNHNAFVLDCKSMILAATIKLAVTEEITALGFVNNDQLAIGTQTGLIEVWDIHESTRLQRLYLGDTRVTQITAASDGSLLAAGMNGELATFRFSPEPKPIVFNSLTTKSKYSQQAWLEHSGRIAIAPAMGQQLFVVDPLASNWQRLGPSGNRAPGFAYPDLLGNLIKIFERTKQRDIVAVYESTIRIWGRDPSRTSRVLKGLEFTTREGRKHRYQEGNHPCKAFVVVNGVLTETDISQSLPYSRSTTVFSDAVLLPDERRLLSMQNSDGTLFLWLRDLDTDELLAEKRLRGFSPLVFPSVTWIDNEHIQVVNLKSVDGEKNMTLVWDLRTDKVSLSSSLALPTDTTTKEKSWQAVHFGADNPRTAWWRPTKLGGSIWIYHPSTDSSTEISLDDGHEVYWVGVDREENLLALRRASNQQVQLLCYDKSRTWNRLVDFDADATSNNARSWFVDVEGGRVYYVASIARIERWNLKTAHRLTDTNTSIGSISKVVSGLDGGVCAVLKDQETAGYPALTAAWTDDKDFVNQYPLTPNYDDLSYLDAFHCWRVGTSIFPVWRAIHPRVNRKDTPYINFHLDGGKSTYVPGIFRASRDGSNAFSLYEGVVTSWKRSVGTDDGPIRFESSNSWNLSTDLGWKLLPGATSAVRCSMSQGGIVALAHDRTLAFCQPPYAGWRHVDLQLLKESISTLQWSSDEKRLAIGLSNGECLIYQPEDEQLYRLIGGHSAAITEIVWFPDGQCLATSSLDGYIVFWDSKHHEIRLRVNSQQQAVNSLAYNEITNTLYSAGEDGTVRIWLAIAPQSTNTDSSQVRYDITNAGNVLAAKADPSTSTANNRRAMRWLNSHGVGFKVATFGVPDLRYHSPANAIIESLEEPSVLEIELSGADWVTDQDFAQLADLRDLRKLSVARCRITPEGLRHLSELSSLEFLDVSGIDLSTLDFRTLSAARNLQTLVARSCKLTNQQVQSLVEHFPRLEVLDLRDNSVDEKALLHVALLNTLTRLYLNDLHLTKAGFEALSKCKKLTDLELANCELDGADLNSLKSLKVLTSLKVPKLLNADELLRECDNWPYLKSIDVSLSEVSKSQITDLWKRRPQLKLAIQSTALGDNANISALLKMGYVQGGETIEIDGLPTKIVDALPMLEAGKQITGLSWPRRPDVTAKDVELVAELPACKRIVVHPDCIPSKHFKLIGKLKGIEELELNSPPYDPGKYKADLATLDQLVRLKLEYASDSDIHLFEPLRNVRSVTFASGQISMVVKTWKNLEELRCGSLKEEDLKKCVPNLQKLQKLAWQRPSVNKPWMCLKSLPNLKVVELPRLTKESAVREWQTAFPTIEILKGK